MDIELRWVLKEDTVFRDFLNFWVWMSESNSNNVFPNCSGMFIVT